MYLGIDPSNYTTSAAYCSGDRYDNASRLLDVREGELGLRQSDALFQHVKRLPEILAALLDCTDRSKIRAVAASTRPREVEGSYMPCFLAGQTVAESIATALDVPFYAFSHQQGHIAAVLYSAGRMELLQKPFLAWHLSGGTTELLLVQPDEKLFRAQCIGGTTDISAGQVIDRTGKLLGVTFPSGKALDTLAAERETTDCFSVKLNELSFSFSGLENKIADYRAAGHGDAETAAYCLRSVAQTVVRVTEQALKQYPDHPVVFSGGVSANSMLRACCAQFDPVFCEPRFATDNALGIAVLCQMQGAADGT
ncbi:MAG: DNA-binding protein [Oscillospiraceae bacterium]|nr:DNA-binding protein [Oscillospiraceae bacterium]